MKKTRVLIGALALSCLLTVPAYAAEWKQDSTGWWWQEDNGSYPTSTWKNIGGKSYYFGADGYMLHDTTTPDGYKVGSDGAWIENALNSDEELAVETVVELYNSLKSQDSLQLKFVKCQNMSFVNRKGNLRGGRAAYIKYSATNSYGARMTEYFMGYINEYGDGEKYFIDPTYSLSPKTLENCTDVVELDKDKIWEKVLEVVD